MNSFFIKTSPSGDIIFQSANAVLKTKHLAVLTANTASNTHTQGTILFEDIPYFFLKSPLQDQPGTLVIFRDISRETKAQRMILVILIGVGLLCSLFTFVASFFMTKHAMIPLQQAWQQQKNFRSDVSHELRAPLAIIQTNLDIVRSNSCETVSSQKKWLDNIHEESLYMAKLVDSLLFLARADSHHQPINKQPLNFNTAILQTLSLFEMMASTKGVALEVLADTTVQGYGDETRIKQVLGILLDNAIRYTSAGGKISVSLTREAEQAVLTVADSGEGIAPEYFGKIFERFYQIDKAHSKGSAGLGLAIAKWIIEAHGGTITVTSTPNQGTAFTICLPLNTH